KVSYSVSPHFFFFFLSLRIPRNQDLKFNNWVRQIQKMFRLLLRSMPSFFLCSLLILLPGFAVEGSVHEYKAEKFVGKGNAFVVHGGSEGIYFSRPSNLTLNADKAANGDSYIRFEKVTFRRPGKSNNFSSGFVQAIVFEVEDRELIGGSAYGGQRAICCTADLAKLGVCSQGEIIHRPSTTNPGWPHVLSVSFIQNEDVATLPLRSVEISRTGMYNLYFMICDPALRDVVVEGKTIWKNPGGYLPGRMAPLMNFYAFMSIAYVILGIFWFSQYARFWKEVFPLQNCITVVITLGMFEMAFWYFDYAEFNETGIRPTGTTVWAVTFGTVKRTVARLIILIVSMGYGVVRPTLGGLTSKVLMLGGTFFLTSEVLELVENVGAVSDFSGKAILFLVLPVALVDAFFILWVFKSLSATLNKLQARRMMVKLDIYRKFTNALAVAVIVSVGWICYELYFKSHDVYNEHWQNAWVIPAFWQFLSFSLLCVICVLWAPSQNSMRYSYSDDASEEFDRDEASLRLIKPSSLPTKDVRAAPEPRSITTTNGASDENAEEEEKTA
ncbi:Transmembrane protein 87A, partial [Linum perenne]